MSHGESVPAVKKSGDKVIGGAINGEGSLTDTVQNEGGAGYLSQVIKDHP
ncbi:hypothetical protein E1757_22360 [Paenibacillus piri]|uniref:P-type ATPase A domain-containing protein n=1 Tax=Paenibacillus piri TaxID=2547395 RepID=A0A4R5KHA1_9BACL|nr:hypothetical protein E1757_22360 [Paenibacillus piri]